MTLVTSGLGGKAELDAAKADIVFAPRFYERMAMFLLKAHRPEKYRDSRANQHKDDTPDEENALSRLLREIDGRSRRLPNRPLPIEHDQSSSASHEATEDRSADRNAVSGDQV